MADVALCVYIYNTFEAYALKSLRTIFCLVNRQTISARLQLGVFTSFHPAKGSKRSSHWCTSFFHFPSSSSLFPFSVFLSFMALRLKGTKKGSDTLNAWLALVFKAKTSPEFVSALICKLEIYHQRRVGWLDFFGLKFRSLYHWYYSIFTMISSGKVSRAAVL